MRVHTKLFLVLTVCLPFTLGASAADDSPWKPLFDGKTLRGWHAMGAGQWTVENGAIVGRLSAEPQYGLLVSDKVFGDFTIRLKFKPAKGNSGFFFRTEIKGSPDSPESHGIQVEISSQKTVGTGGLYASYSDRAFLSWPKREQIAEYMRFGDWNKLVVDAQGGNVTVTVNGFKTAELKNDPGRPKGHFAMQLHEGDEMLVMFKDIEIRGEGKYGRVLRI